MNLHKIIRILLILFSIFLPGGIDRGHCQEARTKEEIIATFTGKIPRQWGERVTGVKTRLNTDQKVIALTFDACPGRRSPGYDSRLIEYLNGEKVPATLFLSGRWIEANRDIFQRLARNPLFGLENHGLNHKPCSANGRSVHGIEGTNHVGEIFDEIELNALRIRDLTGRKPKYYRPGTVYCDEVCVEIAHMLGYEVVSFSVLGDAGATYSKEQVKEALLKASPSSIVLLHMNHPKRETVEGVMEAISGLRKRGFRFVRLEEYGLK